ncbi:ankyrin repeat domain-containing protein [Bordetella sp. 02P26C-1]|uniref:ankyrin repeat domain-containing protein n=1 Tax=Bordetella sp. 02P26C-1 TaxID=2683195 RepID=UPI001353E9A6|nr:ankyrin repeat domain-containing protein [Bordetella sp. 02P26C-1]MVW79751.1 hypothetical protein [Bordetella sp. 02P26C-1]
MIPNVLASAGNLLSSLWPDSEPVRQHAVIQKLIAYIDQDDVTALTALLTDSDERARILAALPDADRSPLHYAAEHGKYKALEVCVDNLPFEVWNLRTRDTGRTPLMLAMENNHDAILPMLKCRLTAWLDSLEHLSVDEASDALIDMKIVYDCDFERQDALDTLWHMVVNARDHEGNTPMLLAMKNKHYECCKALLFRGADVDIRNDHDESARLLALDLPAGEGVRYLLYRAPTV